MITAAKGTRQKFLKFTIAKTYIITQVVPLLSRVLNANMRKFEHCTLMITCSVNRYFLIRAIRQLPIQCPLMSQLSQWYTSKLHIIGSITIKVVHQTIRGALLHCYIAQVTISCIERFHPHCIARSLSYVTTIAVTTETAMYAKRH